MPFCGNTSRIKSTPDAPSFVCELPLRVKPPEARVLLVRLEAARQLYNACLGEAMRRLRLLRESRDYRKGLKVKDREERAERVRGAREEHGFTDAGLQGYAVRVRRSWIGEHLDVHVAQKLGTRAFRAAERVLLGQARKVRFKGRNQMDTVEGKSNEAGIRWRDGVVEWKGLALPAIIDLRDPVVAHALTCRVKYVRLVRRKMGGRDFFFAQLVLEGMPYQKPENRLGVGVVGLDLGPSVVARVSEQEAHLDRFCDELDPREAEIRRLQRRLDRSRRALNPGNYNSDGTVKKPPRLHRE